MRTLLQEMAGGLPVERLGGPSPIPLKDLDGLGKYIDSLSKL